jgi:hypothetical protein
VTPFHPLSPGEPLLLGLVGRMRSGKDTMAGYLIEDHGFRRLAFADALKSSILEIAPIVCEGGFGPIRLPELVDSIGWEETKAIPEARRLLQAYGVAVRRLDPDFWIRIVMNEATSLLEGGHSVVITDVRFPNEASAIEEEFGTIVQIVRPGALEGASGTSHISEHALDDYRPMRDTWTVRNDGDLDRLRARTVHLIQDLEVS